MLTPEMYAAMTASVLQHSAGHIKTALALCDNIVVGAGELDDRFKDANALITELKTIKSDMERALFFLGIDDLDCWEKEAPDEGRHDTPTVEDAGQNPASGNAAGHA